MKTLKKHIEDILIVDYKIQYLVKKYYITGRDLDIIKKFQESSLKEFFEDNYPQYSDLYRIILSWNRDKDFWNNKGIFSDNQFINYICKEYLEK